MIPNLIVYYFKDINYFSFTLETLHMYIIFNLIYLNLPIPARLVMEYSSIDQFRQNILKVEVLKFQ